MASPATPAPAPAPVDPATIPALRGVFAPVHDEHDDVDLVVEGDLPAGLAGAYVRNGPNPLYPPLGSYTYPLDGDGMVHGMFFGDGRVRYRNRIVWTPQLRAERDAGRALWAGVLTPYFPGADVVPAELADGFKVLPDINVVGHAGRWLALGEGDPPVELTPGLDTVGPCDFGGGLPGMCAHPKIDPVTGEMVLFRYDIEEPFLTWAIVGPDGTVARPPQPIDVDGAHMVHDFVITESYVVLFVGPLTFDLDAMLTGGNPLAWRPDRGMRIAVVPRDGSAGARWITTDPFWVWHFANAFERTTADGPTEIVVDHTRWSRPGLGGPAPDGTPITGAITRSILDLDAGTYRAEDLDDRGAEFSRIDDRLVGRPHDWFVATAKRDRQVPNEQDTLVKVEPERGTTTEWHSGDDVFEEVIHVPAPAGVGVGGGEGWFATFRTNRHTGQSDFVLLPAEDITAGPVARIPLPHRVPAGLHANWFPAPTT
jgi:carotenoid cleavage dioxygenase